MSQRCRRLVPKPTRILTKTTKGKHYWNSCHGRVKISLRVKTITLCNMQFLMPTWFFSLLFYKFSFSIFLHFFYNALIFTESVIIIEILSNLTRRMAVNNSHKEFRFETTRTSWFIIKYNFRFEKLIGCQLQNDQNSWWTELVNTVKSLPPVKVAQSGLSFEYIIHFRNPI